MRFSSADQALKFAVNVSNRSEYARSDLLAVRSTSSDSLSSSDLHAQAAMILASVGRLTPVERDILFAIHERGRARAEAIRMMSGHLYPHLSGTLPTREDLALVLMHWATRRPSIRMIAEGRGVSYRKVCNWRSAVARVWVPQYVRAANRLHERLEAGGMELG